MKASKRTIKLTTLAAVSLSIILISMFIISCNSAYYEDEKAAVMEVASISGPDYARQYVNSMRLDGRITESQYVELVKLINKKAGQDVVP